MPGEMNGCRDIKEQKIEIVSAEVSQDGIMKTVCVEIIRRKQIKDQAG